MQTPPNSPPSYPSLFVSLPNPIVPPIPAKINHEIQAEKQLNLVHEIGKNAIQPYMDGLQESGVIEAPRRLELLTNHLSKLFNSIRTSAPLRIGLVELSKVEKLRKTNLKDMDPLSLLTNQGKVGCQIRLVSQIRNQIIKDQLKEIETAMQIGSHTLHFLKHHLKGFLKMVG